MSPLTYASKPRFGAGWKRAAYGFAVVGLVAVSLTFGFRLLGVLTGDASAQGPRSTEERLFEDAVAAVNADPESVRARWELALALSTVGDFSRAKLEAEQAVKLDPESVEAFYCLGLAYRGLGDLERAEKALAKSAALPNSVADVYREVFFELGEVRRELGDSEGAVAAFESALANGPEATYVVIALADAYREVGNDDRAIAEYIAVLGYDPENERAESALRELGVAESEIEQARIPYAHRDDS